MGIPWVWKRTEGSGFSAFHHARLDAYELVDALRKRPSAIIGKHPRVFVHLFGKRRIAVRNFTQINSDYLRPEVIFPKLQEQVAARSAVVETPVAHILLESEENGPRQLVVTWWKDGARPLRDFLEDGSVAWDDKFAVSVSVIRKLARLHALGQLHGHPKLENALALNRRVGALVDPTRLDESKLGDFSQYDFDHEAEMLGGLLSSKLFASRPEGSKLSLKKKLLAEYERAYRRFHAVHFPRT